MAHLHHSHDDRSDDWGEMTARSVRNVLAGAVLMIALATVVGVFISWPRGASEVEQAEVDFGERVRAQVTEVERGPCSQAPDLECHIVGYRVTSGSADGTVVAEEHQSRTATPAASLDAGDQVLLYDAGSDVPLDARFSFADVQRGRGMWIVAAVFAAAVIALGRWRGLLALSGLGASFAVILVFVFPAFLHGSHPVGVALTGASVIAFVTLYMAHGVNAHTTVALLGTVVSLGLIAGLAIGFTHLVRLSGLADEEALRLLAFAPELDFRGLLLAAIIIGALGVLDDVTVTQASAVWELHRASPTLNARTLYTAGVRIGRDHIAATVNTLFLAYAAAALPTLLMYTQSGLSLAEVATSETVAVEIVQTLVGSTGLVAAVPITTALAVWVVTRGATADSPSALPAPPPRPSYDLSRPSLLDTRWSE